MRPIPEILYHYTCDHGRHGIVADGFIKPSPQVFLPGPLVWLTDMDSPDAWALGLTSQILSCDRTQNRFAITPGRGVVAWTDYARAHRVCRSGRDLLESGEARPMHWYVSEEPVPIDA